VIIFSCSSEPQDFIYDYSSWVERIDTLQFNLEGTGIDEIYNYLRLRTNGEYWTVYNSKKGNIVVFDDQLQPVTSLGGSGRGPLEFLTLSDLSISGSNHFIVYDRSGSKIIRYTLDGDDDAEHLISVGTFVTMASDDNENLLIYDLFSRSETVLSLFDRDGEKISDFLMPEDQSYKIFMGMIRNGYVQYKKSTGKFYFLFPDRFLIYEIDSKGEITDILDFESKSPFSSGIRSFPDNLSPFEFTIRHWEYLASFYQPFRFYFVGDDHILFENTKLDIIDNQPQWSKFYNFYKLSDEVVFEGLMFNEFFSG
jgi:hypothetical protein